MELLRGAERPLIVAGGGVLYSTATDALAAFASRHRIPVAETQAGKSAIAWDHLQAVGSIGVTGSSAANTLAREADVILVSARDCRISPRAAARCCPARRS